MRARIVVLYVLIFTLVVLTAFADDKKKDSTIKAVSDAKLSVREEEMSQAKENRERLIEILNSNEDASRPSESVETPSESNVQDNIIYSEYTPGDLRVSGVIYWGGWRFTWYSEKVLPGGGLNIPGRWSDGDFVRDGDGYLCLASSDLAKGTVVDTPWGPGVIYDSGCASGTLDVYASWG